MAYTGSTTASRKAALLLILALAGLSNATATTGSAEERPEFRERRQWAILVGIDDYESKAVRAENGAVEAASALQSTLERFGYSNSGIVLLRDAEGTAKRLFNLLASIGRRAGPNDTLFVYFDGVVLDVPVISRRPNARQSYLVPHDGRLDEPKTLIEFEQLQDRLEFAFPTQSALLVINGLVSPSFRLKKQIAVQRSAPRRVVQVLSNWAPAELSDSRNVFRSALLAGLSDARGSLTAEALYRRMRDDTRWEQSKLRSDYVRLFSLAEPGEFVFAPVSDRATFERRVAAVRDPRGKTTERVSAIGELVQWVLTGPVERRQEFAPELSNTLLSVADGDRDAGVRTQALWGVGRLREKDAAQPLMGILRRTQDPLLQISALEALTEVDREAALEPLRASVMSDDADISRSAISTLARLGDSTSTEQIRVVLTSDRERPTAVVLAALDAMATLSEGDESFQRNVVPLLDHRDAAVRERAIVTLGQVGADADSVNAIFARLHNDESARVREAAAYALAGTSESDRRSEALIEALEDDVPAVRRAAAFALGKVGGERAETALRRLKTDADKEIARIATQAIKEWEASREGSNEWIRDLEKNDPQTQAEAIQRLALSDGAVDAVPALIAKLDSSNTLVWRSAVTSLATLSGDATQERITEALHSEKPRVRQGAAAVLGSQTPPTALAELLGQLDREDKVPVQAELVRSLGAFDAPQALEAVRRLAATEDRMVRVAATDALKAQAVARAEGGQREAALALIDEARGRFEQIPLSTDMKVTGLNELGVLYTQLGEAEKAIEVHSEALKTQAERSSAADANLGRTRRYLGVAHGRREDYEAAENYLLQALGIFERVLGTNNLEVAGTLEELSNTYRAMGKDESASIAAQRAVGRRVSNYVKRLYDWEFRGLIGKEAVFRIETVLWNWSNAVKQGLSLSDEEEQVLQELRKEFDSVEAWSEVATAQHLDRMADGLGAILSKSGKR